MSIPITANYLADSEGRYKTLTTVGTSFLYYNESCHVISSIIIRESILLWYRYVGALEVTIIYIYTLHLGKY